MFRFSFNFPDISCFFICIVYKAAILVSVTILKIRYCGTSYKHRYTFSCSGHSWVSCLSTLHLTLHSFRTAFYHSFIIKLLSFLPKYGHQCKSFEVWRFSKNTLYFCFITHLLSFSKFTQESEIIFNV